MRPHSTHDVRLIMREGRGERDIEKGREGGRESLYPIMFYHVWMLNEGIQLKGVYQYFSFSINDSRTSCGFCLRGDNGKFMVVISC